ncbi:MAG: glycosyltransferase family 4 protein [Streptomycetaceae bacterium]|nr:glycosyltransferase family 4 protein [Streptomycetaceae bacterium]
MKILLTGPDHPGGSIPPYLGILTHQLRALGARVDRAGSTTLPYDPTAGAFWPPERIAATADELAATIDPTGYDVVSLHYGNLEIEQLLPTAWRKRHTSLPPIVHHVHALAPTLFTQHAPDPALHTRATTGMRTADGHVFFGTYAQHRTATTAPGRVIPLPTTIPPGTHPHLTELLRQALDAARPGAVVVTLCGFAAPWKNPQLLIDALEHTTTPIHAILAGPLWDDPEQAGCDLRSAVGTPLRLGHAAQLAVVPHYCGPPERLALVRASTAAVFPYRHQPTFQGSGAIADYLAHRVPVIATDIANMRELATHIVPADDPAELAAALDHLTDHTRHPPAPDKFIPHAHASACLDFYRTLTR